MAHVFLITRGILQWQRQWENFMESQMWWWKRQQLLQDKDGKFIKEGEDENGNPIYKRGPEFTQRVQGALREIKFWEYVLPEPCIPELFAAMNMHQGDKVRKEVAPFTWAMRKMLHAEQVPDFPEIKNKKQEEITQRFIPHQGVATYPIGIKKDATQDFIFKDDFGREIGFYQEGL